MFRGNRRSPTRIVFVTFFPVVFSVGGLAIALTATSVGAFEPRPVPGRLVVELHPSVSTEAFEPRQNAITHTGIEALDALHARFRTSRFAPLFAGEVARQKLGKADVAPALTRYYIVEFPAHLDLESVRRAYEALDAVVVAEYDWMAPLHLQANDSASQWYIQASTGADAHVTGGWNHSTGDPSVVLAIADSGVDWQHPDLGGTGPDFVDGNIWINEAEYNGTPGVDDDGNGFIDDVRGWDFVSGLDNAAPGEDAIAADNDPMDFNGHGTHVAGIASAITNNGIGVAGVGFSCRVMALRIGGSIVDSEGVEQGVVLMSYAAQAINYARRNGAVAFNASWGSAFWNPLDAAVDAATAAGMVIVVSAGNGATTAGGYLNHRPENDTFSVAATTNTDRRAGFSNYGTWVDVAAPGVGIYSTYFDHRAEGDARHTYAHLQGTSMSAPVVTGLVGLVRARWPAASRTFVEQVIEAGCDNIDALNPGYEGQLGAGRINALKTFGDVFLTVPDDYPNIQIALAQSAPGDTIALLGGVTYDTNLLLSHPGRLVQGGWDAGYTTRDAANPSIILGSGTSAVLEVASGIGNDTVLESLRFTGGAARILASPAGRFGGGVLCRDASPVFRDCEFVDNRAGTSFEFGGGGAGFFMNSSARFESCRFASNTARHGGALYALDSDLQLQSCEFDSNLAHASGDSKGASVFVSGGSVTMRGGGIQNGGLPADGGALYAQDAASVDLEAVVLAGNMATRGGAVALHGASQLTMRACVVQRNVAAQLGGGIHALSGSAAIVNTSFDDNAGAGAALFVQDAPGSWSLRNCIVSNHGTSAALLFLNANATLDYNLFWNNSAGNTLGAEVGPNMLEADPRYVDAVAGDLALGVHSPALDSGDPAPEFGDADGTRNDRGAFGGPAGRSRAPAPVAGLNAERSGDSNVLSWSASPELDVASYAIYRSTVQDFAPSPQNFVGFVAVGTSVFAHTSAASSWYRVAVVDESGASSGFAAAVQAVPTTGVGDPVDPTPDAAPWRYALHGNVPNPFNPRTRIRFEIPRASNVSVTILDARGQRVRRLLAGPRPAGLGDVIWDGRDAHGRDVPSGVYVYRVEADRWSASRKMTLLR